MKRTGASFKSSKHIFQRPFGFRPKMNFNHAAVLIDRQFWQWSKVFTGNSFLYVNLTWNSFSYWLYHVLWSTRNWQARQKDHAEVWRAKQNVADLAKPLQTAIATRIRMSKVVGAAKSRLLYAGKSGAGGKNGQVHRTKRTKSPDSSKAYPYPCIVSMWVSPCVWVLCLTLGLQPKLLSAILIMASLKCRTRKMFANKGTTERQGNERTNERASRNCEKIIKNSQGRDIELGQRPIYLDLDSHRMLSI